MPGSKGFVLAVLHRKKQKISHREMRLLLFYWGLDFII
jgi:hypothetical protein